MGGTENTIIRVQTSKDMSFKENSFLLDEASNSVETVEITGNKSNIIQITSVKDAIVWVLMSDGLLYEYNGRRNEFLILEDDYPKSHIILLYV